MFRAHQYIPAYGCLELWRCGIYISVKTIVFAKIHFQFLTGMSCLALFRMYFQPFLAFIRRMQSLNLVSRFSLWPVFTICFSFSSRSFPCTYLKTAIQWKLAQENYTSLYQWIYFIILLYIVSIQCSNELSSHLQYTLSTARYMTKEKDWKLFLFSLANVVCFRMFTNPHDIGTMKHSYNIFPKKKHI